MFITKGIKKELLFYNIMNYPIPNCDIFFYYNKKKQNIYNKIKDFKTIQEKIKKKEFSWNLKSDLMDEYIEYINKYGRIYKSIPFVKDIYLCNSITFNALNKESDIDIVIVSKQGKLWWTRFWSVVFFGILGLKRNRNNFTKRFCLSFYIDESVLNIEDIKEKGEDIYLYYRISHCVKLYQEIKNDDFYIKNNWIKNKLPNFSETQQIFIGNKLFLGKTYFKRFVEFLLKNKIGDILQQILKYIWLPIVLYKKKKLGNKGKNIIISNKMLKFYNDKRYIYNLLFKKKSDI